MGNTLGKILQLTTCGESHGKGLAGILSGCPAGLKLSASDLQGQLDRRKPGTSDLVTPRKEPDEVTILSGVQDGVTLGTPIGLLVMNTDQRPADYNKMREAPRPSHADFTYQEKYGIAASSGGGRASARETTMRVAAGAVAEKILATAAGTEIVAWVSSIHTIDAGEVNHDSISRADVDAQSVRCPDPDVAAKMEDTIRAAKKAGDSVGGVITCVCRNVPIALGEPVFDKADALLGRAMLSIPATKGFEIGSGFSGTRLHGAEHNDAFVQKGAGLGTITNNSGGVQGGITNGEPLVFRVAFKPPATIAKEQMTADFDGNEVSLRGHGRHDPCVLPRAVPIVETMAALVLADLLLLQRAARLSSDD